MLRSTAAATGRRVVYGTGDGLRTKQACSSTATPVPAGHASAAGRPSTQASGVAQTAAAASGRSVSAAAREQIEHWAWCIRQNPNNSDPNIHPRCYPKVALADGDHCDNEYRGEAADRFRESWFDPDNDETPEDRRTSRGMRNSPPRRALTHGEHPHPSIQLQASRNGLAPESEKSAGEFSSGDRQLADWHFLQDGIRASAPAAAGGPHYYGAEHQRPLRVGVIGTGDEGSVLIGA